MAERKVIHIEPDSETGKLLQLVENEPVSLESKGVRYRIEREQVGKEDIFANYDPAKALEGLRKGIGMFEGMDIEEFMREIKAQREQDSIGRPAE